MVVTFDSEWTVIKILQLISLMICMNLLILFIVVFFVYYFVRTSKIINICEFAMSNHTMRIKILMAHLKKIDSLWINTCVNGNVLNGLKSILLQNFKLSNDTTSQIHNMIRNNNNNNLLLGMYICDYFICISYEITFRNNGMYYSDIRMVMRKIMKKKKIIIATIPSARMNIVFILLVIDKTDRDEIILIIYSIILILYIILDDIYQLMYQFMIENDGKDLNLLQENVVYIEKNIFPNNVIYLVARSVLDDVIIFSSIIIILYGLYTMNILEIKKCCTFFKNCRNRKVRIGKKKSKSKDKNSCSCNVMCKDEYFILFLLMDRADGNDNVLNIYSIVLILYIILHGIYQLNCQNMIETKVKHSNILQDNLTYNEKIFVFILIIIIVYVLKHGYLCMNTLFNWFRWIKYTNNNNKCRSRRMSRRNNMNTNNTNNKNKGKSDSNNITIECTQMDIYY